MQPSRLNLLRVVATSMALAAPTFAIAQAAPFKGLSGNITMALEPPALGNASPGKTMLQGTVMFASGKARIDITSASGSAIDYRAGDYVLLPDSVKVQYVRPPTTEFWEMDSPFFNPYAALMGQAGRITASEAQVTMNKLGAGDSVSGFATQKYRINAEYSVGAGGMSIPTYVTIEVTVARTPVKFAGASLAGVQTFGVANSPGLLTRVLGHLSEIGAEGVIVRTRASASFTVQGTNIATVVTSEVTGLKAADVDGAKLTMPAGYKPGG